MVTPICWAPVIEFEWHLGNLSECCVLSDIIYIFNNTPVLKDCSAYYTIDTSNLNKKAYYLLNSLHQFAHSHLLLMAVIQYIYSHIMICLILILDT